MYNFFSDSSATLLYFMDEASRFSSSNARLIKIGRSDNPWRRKEQLQTGNPRRLRLVTVSVANPKVEAQIQDEFSEQHIRGEWFRLNNELLGRIALMHKYGSPGREGWQTGKDKNSSGDRIRVVVKHDKWGTLDEKYDYEVQTPRYYIYLTKLNCWLLNGGTTEIKHLIKKVSHIKES